MNWIKLTTTQANAIAAASASNTTCNFLTPRTDANGAKWISADVLKDLETFSAYASVISSLTPTHVNPPAWPASANL